MHDKQKVLILCRDESFRRELKQKTTERNNMKMRNYMSFAVILFVGIPDVWLPPQLRGIKISAESGFRFLRRNDIFHKI